MYWKITQSKVLKMKEDENLITPLILNSIMCLSQITILTLYWKNMDELMIFGCTFMAFGTALNSIVNYLKIKDIKNKL